MAKINTQFMTKTAENPYPLRPAHTYIAHIREYPPGVKGGRSACSVFVGFQNVLFRCYQRRVLLYLTNYI